MVVNLFFPKSVWFLDYFNHTFQEANFGEAMYSDTHLIGMLERSNKLTSVKMFCEWKM